MSEPMITDSYITPTLCWKCKHAVPKIDRRTGRYIQGCDWSMYRCKVPEWVAIEGTVTFGRNRELPSYIVLDCPKFERG